MFLLDCGDNIYDVQESDIICIEVSRPHIYYRTIHGKYRAPRTLKDFRKIYEPRFMLIDKKKLVNLTLADKFEKGFIHLGDFKYVVSRRIAHKIRDKIGTNTPN